MIIPAGYAQANYRFTGAAVPLGAQITLGLDPDVAVDVTECATLLVETWNAGNMDEYYGSNCVLVGVDVKYGPNDVGPSATGETATPGVGSSTTVPPNVSVLIQKRTALGGHAGRGRLYFPAVPENQVDASGLVSSTWIDGLNTEWADMATAWGAGGVTPVVLHSLGSPLSTPTPITAFVTAAQCATQRRRNRR